MNNITRKTVPEGGIGITDLYHIFSEASSAAVIKTNQCGQPLEKAGVIKDGEVGFR